MALLVSLALARSFLYFPHNDDLKRLTLSLGLEPILSMDARSSPLKLNCQIVPLMEYDFCLLLLMQLRKLWLSTLVEYKMPLRCGGTAPLQILISLTYSFNSNFQIGAIIRAKSILLQQQELTSVIPQS